MEEPTMRRLKDIAILGTALLALAASGCRRSSDDPPPPTPAPATGGLVTPFGTGGIITLNPTTGEDTATILVADTTSLYVIGHVEVGGAASGNFEWRIEKRNLTTGVLDGTFGGGSGVVTTTIGAGNDQPAAAVIDGSDIYIGGYDSTTGVRQGRVEKPPLSNGNLSPLSEGNRSWRISIGSSRTPPNGRGSGACWARRPLGNRGSRVSTPSSRRTAL